jgi:hypothetical protein
MHADLDNYHWVLSNEHDLIEAYPHHAECPPSIFKSDPVMNELASLIKNTAAPLYSRGFDNRPSIFCVGQSALRSGNLTNSSSTIAVTIYPGEMVLTRMLCCPHSEARLRPSWMTPAFEALYAGQMRPYREILSVEVGMVMSRQTYPVRNTPTHTRDHDNAASLAKLNHMLRNRLRAHENTRDVHLKHAVRVFSCVV